MQTLLITKTITEVTPCVSPHPGFAFTNGVQASLVEVDIETGFVKLLKHWCVSGRKRHDRR